jgi:AraC family transcriptional activator of pobA
MKPSLPPPARAVEARTIKSALGPAEFGLNPRQSHLFVLEAGSGVAETADQALSFEAPRLVWLPMGDAERARLAPGARGALLQLSELGALAALPTGRLNMRLRAMLQGRLSLPITDPVARARLSGRIEEIRAELFARAPGADMAVSNLVSLVLVQIWRMAQEDTASVRAAPRGVVERFVQLVAQHRRDHWRVEDYARAAGVSRDRLGSAVQRATGLSPQDYLHRELASEARELLANSGLQVAEIAFRLGFSDPAYFNRFFTRIEGLPPGRWRKRQRRDQGREPTSFAVWP